MSLGRPKTSDRAHHYWSSVVQEQDDDDWMDADTGPLDDYDYFKDDQAFDSDRERRYGGGSAF